MKLCVLTTSYPRSASDDAGIFIKRLVEGYGQAGAGGHVIVPRDANEPESEEQGAFVVKRFEYGLVGKGGLAFGAGILPNLRRRPWLALQAPSLLSAMSKQAEGTGASVLHANWLVSGMAALSASRRTKTPYVITVRGEDVRLLESRVLGTMLGPVARSAAAIVAVGDDLAERVARSSGVRDDRLRVIPNGVELGRFSREDAARIVAARGVAPDRPFLLFVGTVIPRKNVETLVRAIRLPSLSEFDLIVCGRLENGSYARSVERQAADAGDRVKLLGTVPPAEIPAFLELAAYYVSASRFEGRPNALLEAMLAGKAVVASDIESHREIVRSGDNGILFDGERAEALADAITSLEASTAFRQRLQRRAGESIGAHSWKQCAEKYLELFDKLISEAG